MRAAARSLAVGALTALYAFVVLAQDSFEYGSPDDLKGIDSVYVYTGTDMDAREKIHQALKKGLPNLVLASRSEQAQIQLLFTAHVSKYISGVNNYGYNSGVSYSKVIDGSGLVVKVEEGKRTILVLDFRDSKNYFFERHPSTNFAKAFIKNYKQVNGLE